MVASGARNARVQATRAANDRMDVVFMGTPWQKTSPNGGGGERGGLDSIRSSTWTDESLEPRSTQ
jgi:hypothetical protein